MHTAALAALTFAIGSLAAWSMTVPLHRFKESRPKSPRDIEAETGTESSPAQVIRATYRRAICPRCHHNYTSADVAPLVSWLRGCPGCGLALPATVIMLQLGVPVAMMITGLSLQGFVNSWAIIPFLWLVVVLSAVSLVDLRIWLIPYWMPWLGTAIGVVLISAVSIGISRPDAITRAVGGATASFLLFFILWRFAPAKLGFGDVRLAVVLGLFLAWIHPILPIYGLLFGSLIGLVMGLVSLIAKKGNRFPFGPALSAGALAAVWLAAPIIGSFN